MITGAAEPADIPPPFGSHKGTGVEREVECTPVLVGGRRHLKSDCSVILPPAVPFEHLGSLHDGVGMRQHAGNPAGPESGHCCHIPVVADHPGKDIPYRTGGTLLCCRPVVTARACRVFPGLRCFHHWLRQEFMELHKLSLLDLHCQLRRQGLPCVAAAEIERAGLVCGHQIWDS